MVLLDNGRTRALADPKSFQIFPSVVVDNPVRFAIFDRVQCVAFDGVDPGLPRSRPRPGRR